MAADKENQQEVQDENQSTKAGKKDKHPLPYTLEVSFTVWRMIIVLVSSLTAIVSWWNGAALPVIGLRSAAAMISLGGIAVLFNSLLSQSMLEAVSRLQGSDDRVSGSEN